MPALDRRRVDTMVDRDAAVAALECGKGVIDAPTRLVVETPDWQPRTTRCGGSTTKQIEASWSMFSVLGRWAHARNLVFCQLRNDPMVVHALLNGDGGRMLRVKVPRQGRTPSNASSR
jgi:hypothetical protein